MYKYQKAVKILLIFEHSFEPVINKLKKVLKVKYFGHSCFLFEFDDKKVLVDPFISPNPLAKEIHLNEILCDYILVSHGHFDHTADLIHIALSTQAKVICNWEIHAWLEHKNINNTHPMNIGGSSNFGNIHIKMVMAQHSSSMPDGTYAGTAAGFVITYANKCIYVSGDTGLFSDMSLFSKNNKIDMAFLPIGGNFTMDYIDAISCAQIINCKHVIPMHFDTFEMIKIDKNAVIQAFENNGIQIQFLNINEQIEI